MQTTTVISPNYIFTTERTTRNGVTGEMQRIIAKVGGKVEVELWFADEVVQSEIEFKKEKELV